MKLTCARVRELITGSQKYQGSQSFFSSTLCVRAISALQVSLLQTHYMYNNTQNCHSWAPQALKQNASVPADNHRLPAQCKTCKSMHVPSSSLYEECCYGKLNM
ncbi:hypothetical protein ABBQ32_011528 [Trebouxia sp. C0010 RCD-2024]